MCVCIYIYILQFINGSDFQLTDAATESQETALPVEFRIGWTGMSSPTRAILVDYKTQPKILSTQDILTRLSMPKTAVSALHAVWVAKRMFQGTTGNMDLATATLLVAASCGKLDCPFGLRTKADLRGYRGALNKLGVGIPNNVEMKHSALSIKVISSLCDAATLKSVNSLLSAIAVLASYQCLAGLSTVRHWELQFHQRTMRVLRLFMSV